MAIILDGNIGVTYPDVTTQNTSAVVNGKLPEARLPAGSVLQVVNATFSSESDYSSTTFVDTGLTATITPKFATSKILVIVSQADCAKFDSNNYVKLRVLRSGTTIYNFATTAGFTNSTSLLSVGAVSGNYLDSPATTSATTYKTQVSSAINSVGIRLQYNNSTSSITLLEIAG
jgi:hypothetical protein